MTAEIALLNKTGVALAADSAVSIKTGKDSYKIFNTANKLFMLSKYQPVGIMIFSNADFMGTPWESIIKLFRQNLGKTKFNTLEEYVSKFIRFLEDGNPLFPDELQSWYYRDLVVHHFRKIKEDIDKTIKALLDAQGQISDSEIETIVDKSIEDVKNEIEGKDTLETVQESHAQETALKYESVILDVKKQVFKELPVSDGALNNLKVISVGIISKGLVSALSGLVIAGFGEAEIFPSLQSLRTYSVINNKLLYSIGEHEKIDHETPAVVLAFAQKEMVMTFFEGIDPIYDRLLQAYLRKLFDKYATELVQCFPPMDDDKKTELLLRIQDINSALIDEFKSKLPEYKTAILHP